MAACAITARTHTIGQQVRGDFFLHHRWGLAAQVAHLHHCLDSAQIEFDVQRIA